MIMKKKNNIQIEFKLKNQKKKVRKVYAMRDMVGKEFKQRENV